jgi:tRNA(Ile)-lysidine synthase
LKYSNNAINFYIKKNLNENCFFSKKENKIILNNNFFIQPHEVVLRSLSDLLRRVGESYYPVRGKKIEKIINEIEKKEHFKVTLGGCIIKKVNQTVIISKEY